MNATSLIEWRKTLDDANMGLEHCWYTAELIINNNIVNALQGTAEW